MNSRQINDFEDLLEWLETVRPYDDVAENIFQSPLEYIKKRNEDKLRKEKRRIRRRLGRQQRAIQKYMNNETDMLPF